MRVWFSARRNPPGGGIQAGPPKCSLLHFGGVEQNISMFYTYVLLCEDDVRQRRRLYIGYTENLRERLKKHIAKNTKTTKSFEKVSLVYYEACRNKTDARKRELQLKTGFGRGYLKRRIENDLKNTRST